MQAQFDTALADVYKDKHKPIALAVSGGGDSVALLHLAAKSELIDRSQMFVFTVDHRLREGSADEAIFVRELCSELGVSHETLNWQEPAPSQARARSARHRLLASSVRQVGGQILLTGHTLSDNVESFLIRSRAASGWYGLCGMGTFSASPVWPEGDGIFLGRPLLQMTRDDIRDWLAEIGASWCNDPSNENTKYERVRMRQLLAADEGIAPRISRVQQKLMRLRGTRDRALSSWLGMAQFEDDGIQLPFYPDMGSEMLAQGLSLACMVEAGKDRPTRTQRSLAAAQALKSSSCAQTLTLGGAIIRKRGETLMLSKEKRRLMGEKTGRSSKRLQHIRDGLTGLAAE